MDTPMGLDNWDSIFQMAETSDDWDSIFQMVETRLTHDEPVNSPPTRPRLARAVSSAERPSLSVSLTPISRVVRSERRIRVCADGA
ncbi:hypothetical protein FA95DRAFT_1556093 [Auriscalpium vulgare]|uniref:Uncharacterized protein n=1 Tax=Auriscalpium vulgare TaxID=40419 RepID=A0ACB8S1Z6_9AGAM|nr:hypothetical protein FA95DRAFT_1556093 [Auriscalpium vulgare]